MPVHSHDEETTPHSRIGSHHMCGRSNLLPSCKAFSIESFGYARKAAQKRQHIMPTATIVRDGLLLNRGQNASVKKNAVRNQE